MAAPESPPARLRRDLGTLDSYAYLIGILVGAGIFRVTKDAYALTGPSLILGYLVLAPVVLATSIPYVAFLSTPLGRTPGGEYAHVRHAFGGPRVAFLGAWLKLVAYIGAAAFLARVLADYALELAALCGLTLDAELWRLPVASAAILAFLGVQVAGARWFGRVQVAMCLALGVSVCVLVVPGLFAVRADNLRPFATGGLDGFASALFPLFFAFAGFESLAHTAGEVVDSTRRLPAVFVRGIAVTTVIFVAMSLVAFGVLTPAELAATDTPMSTAAARFLPAGAAALVAVGGVLATTTSLNATLFAPARLALVLAGDGLLPRPFGRVHPATGTPVVGLLVNAGAALALLLSGQVALALGIAVFALLVLYAVHALALLVLPRTRPDLAAAAARQAPRGLQVGAALLSIAAMLGLAATQVRADLATLGSAGPLERLRAGDATSLELMLLWGVLGALVLRAARRRYAPGSTA